MAKTHATCMNTENENNCFKPAMREVKGSADLLTTANLEGYGNFRIQVPEHVFEEYARIFAKGYFTVKKIIEEAA